MSEIVTHDKNNNNIKLLPVVTGEFIHFITRKLIIKKIQSQSGALFSDCANMGLMRGHTFSSLVMSELKPINLFKSPLGHYFNNSSYQFIPRHFYEHDKL